MIVPPICVLVLPLTSKDIFGVYLFRNSGIYWRPAETFSVMDWAIVDSSPFYWQRAIVLLVEWQTVSQGINPCFTEESFILTALLVWRTFSNRAVDLFLFPCYVCVPYPVRTIFWLTRVPHSMSGVSWFFSETFPVTTSSKVLALYLDPARRHKTKFCFLKSQFVNILNTCPPLDRLGGSQ